MGIIGKTHGVKTESKPTPKAVTRNAPRPWSSTGRGAVTEDGAAGSTADVVIATGAVVVASFAWVYHAGIANAAESAGAAGSTVKVNDAVFFFGGLHSLSLQVW